MLVEAAMAEPRKKGAETETILVANKQISPCYDF